MQPGHDNHQGGTLGETAPVDHHEETPLPPLLAPLDGSAPEGSPDGAVGRGRSTRLRREWAWAAAVVLVLALVAGTVVILATRSGPAAPTPVASAPLHPIGAPGDTSGSVAVFAEGSTRSLRVEATQLPEPARQSFYEVWLLNPATRKMLPMGVLSPSGSSEYSVSASIMAGYSAVDVSLQANDGDPAHSQTSVLRAYL